MMGITPEDRTYCKLKGIDERIFLLKKALAEINEMADAGRLISANIETCGDISIHSLPECDLTLRIRYYPTI